MGPLVGWARCLTALGSIVGRWIAERADFVAGLRRQRSRPQQAAEWRRRTSLQVQEILDEALAVGGEDRFGVELDTLDGKLAVAQAHDDAVRGARGDLELVGQAFFFDDEGMVAGAGHRRVETGEDGSAIVVDLAGFAMHELRGTDDVAAEGCADGLMAEADAEDGDFSGHVADELYGDAGFVRGAGTRGKNDAVGCKRLDLLRGEVVVAADDDVGAELAHVLDEVEGEGVVVVEDENHGMPF
jgi:hypothetical protein